MCIDYVGYPNKLSDIYVNSTDLHDLGYLNLFNKFFKIKCVISEE